MSGRQRPTCLYKVREEHGVGLVIVRGRGLNGICNSTAGLIGIKIKIKIKIKVMMETKIS